MSIVKFNAASKKAATTSWLMSPWIALLITIVVRLALYMGHDVFEGALVEPLMFHPPRKLTLSSTTQPESGLAPRTFAYHSANGEKILPQPLLRFSIVSVPLDATIWREMAFLRMHFPEAGLPDYLLSVAPWYARYLPPILASRSLPVLWLSLCDGLTAFLMTGWPSCTPTLLYAGFVFNPLMILPAVYESIMSLEWLLLSIVVEGCRCRRRNVWIFPLALSASVVLGSSFLGVSVMLLYPVGVRSRRVAMGSAAALCLLVGIYVLLYHYYTESAFQGSSTFTPLDHSTLCFVRMVIYSSLERCLEIVYIMVPAVIMLPIAMAIQPSAAAETSFTKYIPLVPDVKVFLVSFTIAISVLFRSSLTLPFCCLGVLIMYSNRMPTGAAAAAAAPAEASEGLSLEEPVEYSCNAKFKMFVPIYTALITVPAVWGFYLAYGIWEAFNMNWIFFFNMSFLFGCGVYLEIWMNAFTADIIERESNGGLETI